MDRPRFFCGPSASPAARRAARAGAKDYLAAGAAVGAAVAAPLSPVPAAAAVSTTGTRAVKLALAGRTLTLTVRNTDTGGDAVDELEVDAEDDAAIEIGFSHRYLLDILGNIHGDTIKIALADAGSLPLRLGQTAMRGAGRVGDDGADIAEVGGDAADACRVDDGPGSIATALHVEGQHGAGGNDQHVVRQLAAALQHDGVALDLEIRVPTNAKSFSFQFKFFTFEFPQFACQMYNDTFAMLMDPSPQDPADPMWPDVAFETTSNGSQNVISVNNKSFLKYCTAGSTGYDCSLGESGLAGSGFEGHGASEWDTKDVFVIAMARYFPDAPACP